MKITAAFEGSLKECQDFLDRVNGTPPTPTGGRVLAVVDVELSDFDLNLDLHNHLPNGTDPFAPVTLTVTERKEP